MTVLVDGTQLYCEAVERIRQLEVEIQRMKPAIAALQAWRDAGPEVPYQTELDKTQEALIVALDVYEASEPK